MSWRVLLARVLQNAATTPLVRHTRRPRLDGSPLYLGTVAVFLSELLKCGANFILLAVDEGSVTKATARCCDATTCHLRTPGPSAPR